MIGEKCVDYEVEGVRPRGGPMKSWSEVIEKDCQTRQLSRKMLSVVGNGES